jgi:ferric-dicitrate binding protein FerR (iron transport regulator)
MDQINSIITKSLTGAASEKELEKLQEWLQEDSQHETVFQELHHYWHSKTPKDLNKLSDKWKSLLKQIEQEKNQRKQTLHFTKKRKLFPFCRAAAAILHIASVRIWFLNNNEKNTTIVTAYGEQQSIELPDGTQVKMNANSSLTYSPNWDNRETRIVWLNGEAFFKVRKNLEKEQKFRVITKDLTVEVLGTIFNVNSHRGRTKVYLEEGKIKLNLNGLEGNLLMKPGEFITYSKKSKIIPKKQQSLSELHTSWTDESLIFKNTALREVLEKLEEIYGVTIMVKDTSHYSRKITTGVPIENLEQAIYILEMTIGLKIIKEETGYVIQ